MAGRSPARFLAPLALVASALALVPRGQSHEPRRDREPAAPSATSRRDEDRRRRRRAKKRARRRTYMVKGGDTPSGIAEKTGVPLDADPRAQSGPRPADADPRHEDQAAQMTRLALLSSWRWPARLRWPPRPRRARQDAPKGVGAPSAIVVEASSGDVLWARGADKPPPDRLHHEADDGAADARAERAAGGEDPGGELRRAADRVEARPAPRRADVDRRPAARPDAGVGQRRRGDARRARRRLARAASCG